MDPEELDRLAYGEVNGMGVLGTSAQQAYNPHNEESARRAYLTTGQVNSARSIRPSQGRLALGFVLDALGRGIDLDALERAIATVKAHLEAEAPK